MIDTLSLSRFKSIKKLLLRCRRINIFIGRPNVGKSNLLESLAMLSWLHYCKYSYDLRDFVRYERTSELFYDSGLENPVEITINQATLRLAYRDGSFEGTFQEQGSKAPSGAFGGDYTQIHVTQLLPRESLSDIKFYRFPPTPRQNKDRPFTTSLIPPYGDNLLPLLLAHKELRDTVNSLFSPTGLRLGLRPHENKIEVVKHLEDVIVSIPYSLSSETFQRLAFYLVAIRSSKGSTIIFEEPEAHAFPQYTKQLAETIATDQNQYFLSTHNPYLFLPLLAMAPKEDVAVNVVYAENYETHVKRLTKRDLQEAFEIDIFSNLERYIPAQDLR